MVALKCNISNIQDEKKLKTQNRIDLNQVLMRFKLKIHNKNTFQITQCSPASKKLLKNQSGTPISFRFAFLPRLYTHQHYSIF